MSESRPEKIAVFTASSNTGAACVNTILSASTEHSVRAIFRSEKKAEVLRKTHGSAKNLEIVTGADADDSDSVVRALSGCTVALLVTPFNPSRGFADDATLVDTMMRAAAEAGVKHIIFAASWTVKATEQIKAIASRFAPGERLLEELEKSKGITWTVVRGGFFLDNYSELVGKSLRTSDEFSFADVCIPANDPADMGRVSAYVAMDGGRGHEGKKYEISGPERLWMGDVAKICSEVLDRKISFVKLEKEACLANLPPFLQEMFEYMIDVGEEAVPLSNDVEQVTGKPAVSLREWLAAHREDFARVDTSA